MNLDNMKKYNFLFLLCFSLFFWNCAEQEMEWQDEAPLVTKATDDEVEEMFAENTPRKFIRAAKRINDIGMGKKLIDYAKGMQKKSITLTLLPDDGTEYLRMSYRGFSKMYYSASLLKESVEVIDDLLFHEMFHLVQNGDGAPQPSLNNEVEAYLVQYLYAKKSGGEPAGPPTPRMRELLAELVTYIDDFGYVKENVDREKFNKTYIDIMEELKKHRVYGVEGWEANDNPAAFNFPNIVKLLSKQP